MMVGHLGNRVSALVDGRLSPVEEERAWAHVHVCQPCRRLVEREGWVKTRLAGLGAPEECSAPAGLKGALACAPAFATPPEASYPTPDRRHTAGIALLGAGSVGAAMVGFLALASPPAQAPAVDRRAPVARVSVPTTAPAPPARGERRRTPVTEAIASVQATFGPIAQVQTQSVSTGKLAQ